MSDRTIRMVLMAALVTGTAACNREEAAPPAAGANTPAASTQTAASTDGELTTQVQARYYADDTVRGRDISVSAENGVVTLRGAVDSEAARDRAVSLARDVQGVSDVRNELRVPTATDTAAAQTGSGAAAEATGTAGRTTESIQPGWVTTKIQAQYFVNAEIKPWNIDVTTNNAGVVTLEGEVDSADDRAEAVRIASATEGVSRVENRLRVKTAPASGDAAAPAMQRPDVWLTAKVQSKYFLDDDVKGRDLDVSTENGVVTLTGTVATEAERRHAIALARNTEGVRDVTDQVKVDPAMREQDAAGARADEQTPGAIPGVKALERPDPWITMKIQSQFFLDRDIKAHEINVDTTRGVVLLKGSVSSAAQKQQAEQIARGTEGVSRVVNELTVENQ